MQDNQPQRRTIRSFVRRTGRLTPSQRKALAELWPDYGLQHEGAPLDFGLVFSRVAPVVLEIGFGNGETLVQQAVANPDMDFIGIEVHEPGVGHCLLGARDADARNLRLICHDAIDVLSERIAEQSLTRVNLYFPDPWPKKKHHKRRIIQHDFLALIAGRLTRSGTFCIATDWANYAEHIDEVLGRSNLFKLSARREHDGGHPMDRPRTKFEQRGLKKGHRIVDWCYTKTETTLS